MQKISKCHKNNSFIFLHSNDCKTPYIDIYSDLLSINFNLLSVHFSIMLTIRSVILKSIFTNNHIIGKYIVLSNTVLYQIKFCVFVFRNPSWYQKKLIVLLHTLSAYDSLLVRCKVYSSDPRECFCTSTTYAEAYENFSIEPALCQKNPTKKIKLSLNFQSLLIGENYTETKAWQLKFA